MEDRIRVMIIDNYPFTIDAISYFFESQAENIEVVCKLTDGKKALSSIDAAKPDVIVMDPYLSTIDGVELTREIIEKRKKAVKLVMFSSYACPELVKIAYKMGVHAFVLKEEPFKVLINAVKQSYLGNIILSNPKVLEHSNFQLTLTEIEILKLITQEKKNYEIAKELKMSKRTVEYHITSIFQKLKVDSRVGAVMKAAQKGLIYI